ncbi:MAG TPA: Panacea domain-containing protein [Candidatus Acidoferrum sp.]|jgi:hypothetical protein|nr:Panacea domain-containing protein [Candidatus Acidoferrum sp.]
MKLVLPNDDKLKELILYVSTQSVDDTWFGAVKLNKILFYADFLSYLKRGESITGQEYFALREGPAPKRMLPITDKMISDGEFAYQLLDVGMPHRQKKPIALRPPDLKKLRAEDIAIVNEVIDKLRGMNGTQTSEMSHRFAGYVAAFAQGEKTKIPYSTVRFDTKEFWGIETPPLSQKLISYGKQLAKKLGKRAQPAGV